MRSKGTVSVQGIAMVTERTAVKTLNSHVEHGKPVLFFSAYEYMKQFVFLSETTALHV